MTSESPVTPPVETASPQAQSKQPVPKYEFEGHDNIVWDFVFLHDNIHVVSGSADGTMRKWSCDTGLAVGNPWKGEGGRIYALALSPDGKKIACGRGDGSVQQWNTEGKMIEGIWTGHNGGVRSLSWSPSGDHIASGSNDGKILIRKAGSGEVEVGPIESKQAWVLALAYSPSGNRIASGGSNKTICIWNSKTGQLAVGPVEGLGTSVTSVAWSLDGTKLYTASDNFARVFDNSGTQLLRLEQDFAVNSIALSPKHNLLVCVGYRGIAQLWDTTSHHPLGQPFHQHEMDLCCALFSQDGRYLVYGGYDHKMSLWIVEDIAPELASIQPTSRPSLEGDATNRHSYSRGDEISEHVRDDHTEQEIQPPSRPSIEGDAINRGDEIYEHMRDDHTEQEIQPPSQPSLEGDATNRHAYSGGDEIYEDVRDDQGSLPRSTPSHKKPVVNAAASYGYNRNIPSRAPIYKKTNDTRRPPGEKPVVLRQMTRSDSPSEMSWTDSLPNVHWCTAFLCYFSCWSNGRLRMPPRWDLEPACEPRKNNGGASAQDNIGELRQDNGGASNQDNYGESRQDNGGASTQDNCGYW